MRVLIVNRHFGDEHVPTARMAGDVAEALLGRGHEVTVLTAPTSYSTVAKERSTSGKVRICHTFTLGERVRLVSWILFLVQAWIRIPFMAWDRCLLLTDPPFLAAVCVPLSPLSRRLSNVFWWTMDLYPEILVSSGRVKERGLLYAALRRVNEAIIRRSGGFVLLGKCQLQRLRAYSAWKERDYVVVPPWDIRPITRVGRDTNRFLERYGLRDKKVALYAGNLGEGHTFEPLVQAAKELARQQRDDWAIVFVIRGAKKLPLTQAAEGLPSVRILDYQPPDLTADLLWSAHVHLITMNSRSKGLVVPSKLYGVLQTDAPVLFIGPEDADTADEIARYCAGSALSEAASGAQILDVLDALYTSSLFGSSQRISPDSTGPDRVAAFVTR